MLPVTYVYAIGFVLIVLAVCDRRTWPFLGAIALSWGLTEILHANLPVEVAIYARISIDALGALLAWGIEGSQARKGQYERWMGGVRAAFVLMLLAHAMFWLARSMGVDLWLIYANGLNVLALAQLGFVAGPGVMRLVTFLHNSMAGVVDSPDGVSSTARRTAVKQDSGRNV